MRLVMHPPEEGAELMRREIRGFLGEGRRVIIVAYGLRTLDLLRDVISSERNVFLIPSFFTDFPTSLLLLASSIKFREACLVDEIFGSYLRAVSSSPKPYEVQRSLIVLLGLIGTFEKQVGAFVSMHTSEADVPDWFLKMFDSVENHWGG